jgi:hypothetical protein
VASKTQYHSNRKVIDRSFVVIALESNENNNSNDIRLLLKRPVQRGVCCVKKVKKLVIHSLIYRLIHLAILIAILILLCFGCFFSIVLCISAKSCYYFEALVGAGDADGAGVCCAPCGPWTETVGAGITSFGL